MYVCIGWLTHNPQLSVCGALRIVNVMALGIFLVHIRAFSTEQASFSAMQWWCWEVALASVGYMLFGHFIGNRNRLK